MPITFMGDVLYATTQTNFLRPFNQLSMFIGEGGFSDLTALPEGAYPPVCWRLPLDAGSLSSHQRTICTATATLNLVQGMALAGATAGTCTAEATGGLVVSCSGTSAGTSTSTATINAVLFGAGTSAGTCTVTAAISAIAWCIGQADGTSTATLGSYATGRLYGHIYVNQSEATVEQIVDGVWNAEASMYDEPATMGEAVNAAGTAGDPWTTVLPGSYTGEQAGNIIGKKLLTTGKFIALK